MRWTEWAMLTLPNAPRRVWLLSFWLAVSFTSGLCLAAVGALTLGTRWGLAGGLVILGMALPGILRPQLARRPYRLWNAMARLFNRGASLIIRAICFYVVLVPVGWAGSSLRLERPRSGVSLWNRRDAAPSGAYFGQALMAPSDHGGRRAASGWMPGYLQWTRHPADRWAVGLFPLLVMLSIFEGDSIEVEISESNYTLY
jgi:hypothetical protein